jgi:V/A-type H+-transporting ATPase subunit C
MFSRVGELFSNLGPSGSSSGGRSNYPYVTARVRSMKSHLLPEEEYPRMVARDVHEIARSLQEGRYQEEVDRLSSEYSGAQLVEQATWQGMGREFRRILDWCEGPLEAMVARYFERFTVYNVKTALRGARSGASTEETEQALVPVGLVDRDRWQPALNADTMPECIEALRGLPYGDVVQDMDEESLPVIENALDRTYYERLIGSVKADDRPREAYLRFLRREIDTINLKNIFRAKHAGVEDFEYVKEGEDVDEDLARRILQADWEEVPALLDETDYGEDLRQPVEAYRDSRDLNLLANELEDLHLAEADTFGHRYPLSILPIIDYVLQKEREVDRLRMIAFGKQAGLSREEIEDLVTN